MAFDRTEDTNKDWLTKTLLISDQERRGEASFLVELEAAEKTLRVFCTTPEYWRGGVLPRSVKIYGYIADRQQPYHPHQRFVASYEHAGGRAPERLPVLFICCDEAGNWYVAREPVSHHERKKIKRHQ